MDDLDVFDLLAGSVDETEGTDVDAPVPPPWPPFPNGEFVRDRVCEVSVQSVLLEDVRALGDNRFNSTNHHEFAPFRKHGENAVLADPAWWASLGTELRAEIEASVSVEVASEPIGVPHEAEIKVSEGCNALYQAYLDGFGFARWAVLQPEALLVPLAHSDRMSLEALARRQVLGGSGLQDGDLEMVSSSLLMNLQEAIEHVGGRAFAKTAEKSAKNDVVLRPHETSKSILEELTASQDVLQQSLGQGGTGKRQTARYLVVQPWNEHINKSNEFRVIIQGRHIVGITQQSWACFVGHTEESVMLLVPPMLHLWYSKLLPLCPYVDCVLDVFVANGVAQLIEVNPCGFWGSSGSGLFHWIHDRDLLLSGGPLIVRIVVEARATSTIDAQNV